MRSGGVGSVGWVGGVGTCGWGAWACERGSIEVCVGVDRSVGPLGLGDGSLVHHTR
jgi:hypothetical protein